jgi:hypothetical protein
MVNFCAQLFPAVAVQKTLDGGLKKGKGSFVD